MKQDIAQKWIAALRDPNNRQGTKALCKFDEEGINYFCCLGLLTDLYLRETGGSWNVLSTPDKTHEMESLKLGVKQCDNEFSVLPPKVLIWSGLRSLLGERRGYDMNLTRLNDLGYTFLEIADIIETEWKTL